MRSTSRAFALLGICSIAAAAPFLSLSSCKSSVEPPTSSYFDREISPILEHSCSRQTAGCHIQDDNGNALGNLDTTTFERLDRRRDLLITYGPYALPGLLQKVVGPQTLDIQTFDGTIKIKTDIRHAAGAGLDITSDGYATLKRWLDNGATKANTGSSGAAISPSGACRKGVPDPTFDASKDPFASYKTFVDKVQPVLKAKCSAGTCHGGPAADLALSCGDTEEERRWNAYIASQFLASPPEESEILRRSLDPGAGGTYHSGGGIFKSTSDSGYTAISDWAKEQGAATVPADQEGLRFFGNRVQPVLVRKGCMFNGCHSALMFHEYELRGGSGGRFSVAATKKNYDLTKKMMSFESPDASVGRLLAKTTYPYDRTMDPTATGILHRGGALFEDVPGVEHATPADCAKFDAEKGDLNTIPGYCVIVAWHKKERDAAIAAGKIFKDPISAIVYVSRPPDGDVPQAFDTYRPGAELHVATASLDATGNVVLGGADEDVTSKCGLSSASADIRRPAVNWTGTLVAFAARTAKDKPLRLYTMKPDGSDCKPIPGKDFFDQPPTGNEIPIHDFDPAWSPDGRMVFASTRGAIGQSDLDYSGPTRTVDALLPNANIYIWEPDPAAAGAQRVRQMTFLNGMELAPAFKRNGQFVFTTEKRAPGFYQLAARRHNVDGTDYHPLYGQRKSIGFTQLIDVRHLADGNIVAIFSDRGAKARAGTLGVGNRSLGPDQADRDPNDRFFLHGLSFPDPSGSGKPGTVGSLYRSPAELPTRSVLVSFATGDPGTYEGPFELVQLDTRNGTRRPLIKVAGKSIVDAVAVYARQPASVFVPGSNEFKVDEGHREARMRNVDIPMIASLMFDNRRGKRDIQVAARALGILESLPPDKGVASFDAADPKFVVSDEYGKMWFKRRRIGVVPLYDDGSVAFQIPGGVPIVLELYKSPTETTPYVTQLEEGQLYPGEVAKNSFRGQLFGTNCGGCHGAPGAVSNTYSSMETDIHLRPDIITEASKAIAITSEYTDLFKSPEKRGTPFGK